MSEFTPIFLERFDTMAALHAWAHDGTPDQKRSWDLSFDAAMGRLIQVRLFWRWKGGRCRCDKVSTSEREAVYLVLQEFDRWEASNP